MSQWIRAAQVADCGDGSSLECVLHGRVLAVFCVHGEPYVMDGVCPHQGGPLGKGTVLDCVVTCPWHGWQFDVRTGQHQVNGTLRHPTFPARIRDGWIEVQLPAE